MYIPQIDDIVKVKTNEFEGLGKVTHIEQQHLYTNHYNPIQVDIDGNYDIYSEHTILRVNLREITKTFKLIVAGGRDFNDYKLLKSKLDSLLKNKNKNEIIIVSGGARGADTLGEKYAMENEITLKRFLANWDLGKQAGYIRNKEMSDYSDAVIAFWDGSSKGTGHMIDIAKEKGLQLRVINYV